jgi:hypothetical protein
MLNINSNYIVGATFNVHGVYEIDPNTVWICIGYGQDPKSATNYIVGITHNTSNDSTTIKTHLLKDVVFSGHLSNK